MKTIMQTVVGLLKTRDEAQFAVRDLVTCGFREDAITIRSGDVERHAWPEEDAFVEKGERSEEKEGAGLGSRGIAYQTVVRVGPGDVATLTELGIPEPDARYYSAGVERGGYLITVEIDNDRAEEAAEIIRRHGAIEDERGDSWRGQGWTGYQEALPQATVELGGDRQTFRESEPLSHATLSEQLERAELFEDKEELPRELEQRKHEQQSAAETEAGGLGVQSGPQIDVSAMDDEEFERHFRAVYGDRGERFEEPYRSAYHFAETESSSHPQFVNKQWYEVEEEFHRDWERSHPGTWNKVEDAIHFGWNKTRSHH
jgi:hypothetical protein